MFYQFLDLVYFLHNIFFVLRDSFVLIFLQKRSTPLTAVPEWVDSTRTEQGFQINQYFVDHPEMVLGELKLNTRYGEERGQVDCVPIQGADLKQQLHEAIANLKASISQDAPAQEKKEKELEKESRAAFKEVREEGGEDK